MGIREKARLKMDELADKARHRSRNKVPDQRDRRKGPEREHGGTGGSSQGRIHQATDALKSRLRKH